MRFPKARAKVSKPKAGLTSTFPQTEMKDHPASLGVTCDKHVDLPAISSFIARDYSYKLLATQFLPNAGSTLISYTGCDPIRKVQYLLSTNMNKFA